MSKYEIRDVVSDYGIYEDGELKLILNSGSNAEYIKAILEVDGCLPNAATVYSPKVEAMSDEECLAVFRLCCEKEYNCEKCPFFDTDACCQWHIVRRVLAMAERALKPSSARCDCEKQREEGAARFVEAESLIKEIKSIGFSVRGVRSGKGLLIEIIKNYQKLVLKTIEEHTMRSLSFDFELEKCKERGKQLEREHDAEVARGMIEFIKEKIKELEDHTPTKEIDQAIALVNWILGNVINNLEKKYTEGTVNDRH